MGKLSSLRNDALLSFLRMVAMFLVPLLVALAGLALLATLPTALLWVAIIAAITYLCIRFNDKHNEHPEYDDHPPMETYSRGLQAYLRLVGKEEDRKREET